MLFVLTPIFGQFQKSVQVRFFSNLPLSMHDAGSPGEAAVPRAVADGEEGRAAADRDPGAVLLLALALILPRRGTLLPHATHRVHQVNKVFFNALS